MDLGAPVLDVAPGVRGALLQELARLEQPVTRRQLAAAAGVAPGHASAVVEELVRAGLVSETLAGRSSMVALNRSHLAAGPVLALASLRGELICRLRERLSGWSDLLAAWLFGSVARGDAGAYSDIDLMIVADDLESRELHERLAQLHSDVESWTGNGLHVVEHSDASWRELLRAKNPLVEQIRLDGIALTGNTPLVADPQHVSMLPEGSECACQARSRSPHCTLKRNVEDCQRGGLDVVVAHSGSGLLLPAIASATSARAQVYLAAFIPHGRISLIGELAEDPAKVMQGDWIGVDPTTDHAAARHFLFHDCHADDVDWATGTLRSFVPAAVSSEIVALAPHIPALAVVPESDRTLRTEWMIAAAEGRLGIEPIVVPGGHCPHVSRPAALAKVLIAASSPA